MSASLRKNKQFWENAVLKDKLNEKIGLENWIA